MPRNQSWGKSADTELKDKIDFIDDLLIFSAIMATSSSISNYQSDLIEHAMSVEALKFGSFTLKSGRCVNAFTTRRTSQ
jgi:hypothetical protein